MFNKIKSPETLFNSTITLSTLNQNILYLTREVDRIVRMVKQLAIDDKLQTQVDKYFDEGAEAYPGLEDTRTSPQTDPKEQNGNRTDS